MNFDETPYRLRVHLSHPRRLSPFCSRAFAVTRCPWLNLWPTRIRNQSSISIGSAVFVGLKVVSSRHAQIDRPRYICSERPHFCRPTLCMRCDLIRWHSSRRDARLSRCSVNIIWLSKLNSLLTKSRQTLTWTGDRKHQTLPIWCCPSWVSSTKLIHRGASKHCCCPRIAYSWR